MRVSSRRSPAGLVVGWGMSEQPISRQGGVSTAARRARMKQLAVEYHAVGAALEACAANEL